MDCSTPGLPVHHQLPELAQTHVHGVGDAIPPSHPLPSPSPPPMDCSLPGSSVHGIFQARVLEWGAIASSEEPNGNLAIIVVLTYDFP